MGNNNESKQDRFKRLAEKRTARVLDDFRILSHLSNRGLYSYTPDQLRKIFGAIKEALSETEKMFNKGKKEKEREFKL